RMMSRSIPFKISTRASPLPSERVTARARMAIVVVGSVGACIRKGPRLARRYMRYGASLLLLQLALGCTDRNPAQDTALESRNAAAGAAAPAPAADSKLVVAFGDSL